MTSRSSLIPGAAVAAVLLLAPPALRAHRGVEMDSVDRFEESVRQYVALHRTLERRLTPLAVSPDARVIYDAIDARAAAIRQARAGARTGDVFAADVAELFRARIERAFDERGYSAAALFAVLYPEENDWATPAVNVVFSWRTTMPTPPCVLQALPPLPEELQYRFVGPHLVLVDIEANLIIDVLPDAISFAERSHV